MFKREANNLLLRVNEITLKILISKFSCILLISSESDNNFSIRFYDFLGGPYIPFFKIIII